MKVSTAILRTMPSGPKSTSRPVRGKRGGEGHLEPVAVETIRGRLRQTHIAGVGDLESDLWTIVVAKLHRAKREELVAARGVVTLAAALRQMRQQKHVPIRARARA
jgi:glucokinase